MVLRVVSNKGDVRHLHIFEAGCRITTKVHLDVLSTVFKLCKEKVAAGRPYIFQQDSAPVHTSHMTCAWFRENLQFFWEKDVWPPQLT